MNVARPFMEQLREIENKTDDDLEIGGENEENEPVRGPKVSCKSGDNLSKFSEVRLQNAVERRRDDSFRF